MSKVTGVIGVLLVFALITSCGKSEKTAKFQLPEKVEHKKPGKINPIIPKALVDSINAGVNMDIFFLHEDPPDNPNYIVPIPGIIEIPLGDIFFIAETLSIEHPLYLVCLWGDDAKKVAERLSIDGISSYYLDGGSYRLYKEMQENGWALASGTTGKAAK
ncbi:MAG: hypothetical protein P9X24_09685 [Candidatus Hatepunaea meridiana]|nr:hypothetical protein [Candidatus Hatepunaea meridiana]